MDITLCSACLLQTWD